MSDLNCYITTFNCGRTLLDVDYFAANLFNGLKTNVPPDLVVLTLQEIAPIAHSFLGGSYLAPYFNKFTTSITFAASKRFGSEVGYENVLVRHVGMTAIMLFAKGSIREQIRRIETAGVGVGLWDMGNKGAVAVRLGLDLGSQDEESAVTFVAAHLAPMEDAWQRRNEDWKSICQGLVFERDHASSYSTPERQPLLSDSAGGSGRDKQSTLFSPTTHVFFSGDLNYRTSDTSPKPEDFEHWPQPVESVSDVHHYGHLLAHDQLSRERRNQNTLHLLTESEIKFPPTYKYSSVAQKRAAHAPTKVSIEDEDQVWLWAGHRIPSWCDRILYLASAPPTVHSYTALPVQPTSDHRPVVLSCSISLKSTKLAELKPPFAIRSDWKEAREAARRYELMVGYAAYLALTWEGEALLAGTVIGLAGGYLVLRALMGA